MKSPPRSSPQPVKSPSKRQARVRQRLAAAVEAAKSGDPSVEAAEPQVPRGEGERPLSGRAFVSGLLAQVQLSRRASDPIPGLSGKVHKPPVSPKKPRSHARSSHARQDDDSPGRQASLDRGNPWEEAATRGDAPGGREQYGMSGLDVHRGRPASGTGGARGFHRDGPDQGSSVGGAPGGAHGQGSERAASPGWGFQAVKGRGWSGTRAREDGGRGGNEEGSGDGGSATTGEHMNSSSSNSASNSTATAANNSSSGSGVAYGAPRRVSSAPISRPGNGEGGQGGGPVGCPCQVATWHPGGLLAAGACCPLQCGRVGGTPGRWCHVAVAWSVVIPQRHRGGWP
eukprot:jgi/Mesvir1/8796/Mv02700-RA.1